ncbi:unnamed protein product [Prunus armeniaca]
MFSKFEFDGKLNPTFVEGAFNLPLSSIRAYLKKPITPRFVHLGSAGVTQPDRHGLDLSKQPPTVRLNKELDFILTFKLKLFRFCTLISFGAWGGFNTESGIPYTIVRPCALTEEPAGVDLIFDQGDNITVYNQIEDHYSLFVGKISREEVAQICVAALESPYASGKTFEVTARLMSLNCVLRAMAVICYFWKFICETYSRGAILFKCCHICGEEYSRAAIRFKYFNACKEYSHGAIR